MLSSPLIPYGRQDINQADIDAVVEVLQSDFLTQGPAVPRFEEMVANYCGAKHAVAVNSATSALHLACIALEVGAGDIVWTSPITFVASANCALYCGAKIDFVDIDPLTYNMSVLSLEEKLKQARITGDLPKVVIVVHLCGQSCDMESIAKLSKEYGFNVIEDASHAIGGRYQDLPIGSCKFSDLTIFSFHPVKIITSAEGGMVLTNNLSIAMKIRLLRTHGIINEIADTDCVVPGEIWNYQQIDLGFNYRLTDIQAALGISQMARLDNFVKTRNEIAARYTLAFSELPLIAPLVDKESYSSFHLYVIRLNLSKIKLTHQQIYQAMRDFGILVNLHYIPVYRHPFYQKLGFTVGYCPEAEKYYSDALSLPIYSTLSIEQQQYVVEALQKILV